MDDLGILHLCEFGSLETGTRYIMSLILSCVLVYSFFSQLDTLPSYKPEHQEMAGHLFIFSDSFHEMDTPFPDFLLRTYAFISAWRWSSILKRTTFCLPYLGVALPASSVSTWTQNQACLSFVTTPAYLCEIVPSLSGAC